MYCKCDKYDYIKGYRFYGERRTKVAARGCEVFLHVIRLCLIMCLRIVVILLI